jgi:DNA-binding CsgD family transcriptional regulator
MALRSIQQTVRADDRVCPYALSRIAIAFGADADAVAPKTLGERLARAVGNGADKRNRGQHRMASVPSTMVVTVDRLLTKDLTGSATAVRSLSSSLDGPVSTGSSSSTPLLRHRTVVRYSTCRLAGYGTRHDDHLPDPVLDDSPTTVLVVDPSGPSTGGPSLAAAAACSLAERLGFTAAVISLSADDHPILDIGGIELDLVILVIGTEPANQRSTWSSSTWSVPAQIAAAYQSLGVDVLAVSAGAGAGALAACVEQGATVLVDIDGLSAELRSMFRENGAAGVPLEDGRRSAARFEPLIRLTASERRVLYYLTKGVSAQEISDELVVSLATVRSHIRSILRKLGVKSQLAAVAIANSRDLDDIASVGAS